MLLTKGKGHTRMKVTNEQIRTLQKDGEYKFEGLSREESEIAATELAKATMNYDRKYGIESTYGIARNAFGYYYTTQING